MGEPATEMDSMDSAKDSRGLDLGLKKAFDWIEVTTIVQKPVVDPLGARSYIRQPYGEGQWPSGRIEASEPGSPGFDSSSRLPQVVARQDWARWITAYSTPSLVLCCAWLVTMALHVHCGLGKLSPLPTSGDDKWVAAKHCGRAKRSRISDTHRLRSSLQFRYINSQSLLTLLMY